MKRIIEKEVLFCDNCGLETDFPHQCLGCGKEFCHICSDKLLTVFSHGVNVSGHGDGYFCKNCLANPPERIIPLLKAYQEIENLRNEIDIFLKDFGVRSGKAEVKLKKLYKEIVND